MKLSAQELGLINFSMSVGTEKNQMGQILPKTFPKLEELDALHAFKKISVCTEGEGDKKRFVDGEVQFTTAEKTLILKCLDREWGIQDLEAKVGLCDKLNAAEEKVEEKASA